MIQLIVIGVVAVLVLLIVIVAMQPSAYKIVRSASISAPITVVFGLVNDFHRWEAWSPWAKLDPEAKNSFAGPPSGTGAMFGWSGNKKIGEGRMAILESRPHELIRIKLDFIRPFASTCTTEFTFQTEANQTAVTWCMMGNNGFMAKAFCLFMNMDKMVGGDFERGLALMQTAAEAQSKLP